jgi:hypothetical protein
MSFETGMTYQILGMFSISMELSFSFWRLHGDHSSGFWKGTSTKCKVTLFRDLCFVMGSEFGKAREGKIHRRGQPTYSLRKVKPILGSDNEASFIEIAARSQGLFRDWDDL